ncbi:MAG: hypothetical protein KDA28_08415, partial [Phycisphaerales bacterium]|nr:hypothetical protein [Phycisphaerales bacterium]
EFHRSRSPLRMSTLVRDLDPAVERVILRCLQTSPKERPRSVLEVSAALPGSDPLAAALAAGETPSPELVAAGEADSMPRLPAIILFVLLTISVMGVVASSSFDALASYVTTERPPDALRDKARDVLAALGHDAHSGGHARSWNEAYGFAQFYENLTHLKDEGIEDWSALATGRPLTMVIWYRISPATFVMQKQGLRAHKALFDNPPFARSSEARLLLDMEGRLDRIEIIPTDLADDQIVGVPSSVPDFEKVFELAGLDISRFEPIEPTYQSRYDTDESFAWSGTIDGIEGPMQVVAGTRRGQVVHVKVRYPWHLRLDEAEKEASTGDTSVSFLEESLRVGASAVRWINRLWLFPAIGLTTVLAFRSLRDRRGDTRSATIIAAAVFTTMLFGLVFSSQSLFLPASLLLQYMSIASFVALGGWAAYNGIQPSIRRLWPLMLVSWTRLLSGRVFDPLVGRSMLIGALVGAATTFAFELASAIRFSTGGAVPAYGNFEYATGMRFAAGEIAISLCLPLVYSFVQLIGLVGLRAIVRRQWLATLIFFVILSGADSRIGTFEPWTILISIGASAATVFLFLHYGVLSVIVMMLCDSILKDALLTTDVSAWYFPQTVVVVGLILGLGLFGMFASSKGRPLLRLD